ncbi:SYF2 factor, partial [Polyodon spathula]|nr:SYF2 factor [Polyodon spathula]
MGSVYCITTLETAAVWGGSELVHHVICRVGDFPKKNPLIVVQIAWHSVGKSSEICIRLYPGDLPHLPDVFFPKSFRATSDRQTLQWSIVLVCGYLTNLIREHQRSCSDTNLESACVGLLSAGPGSSREESECSTASLKREDRLRKFRELHFKRNEARKLNHQEVVEEDKRLKLPSNWEAKKARLEWELQVDEKKKECAAKGEDYNRVKLLDISAEDAERWERKKKKRNPDPGFSDYAAAQLRQYQRLTKQIKPDMENYEKQRDECGDEFYPTSNSLLHGSHVPSKEGVDRMVEDVEKQIEKRAKYSRRRAYNDDADIDYINERNAKFNKKAERFYGKYTAEIKQNLERGTAV